MEYRADDRELQATMFIEFVNQVWPGNYDMERTQDALSKTINITAYDGERLVGYFGTITELLVLPEYQRRGIGSRLLQLARDSAPTMLYFGAQPGVEAFYEKNGCEKGLQSYVIRKKRR